MILEVVLVYPLDFSLSPFPWKVSATFSTPLTVRDYIALGLIHYVLIEITRDLRF